jgi:DNA-binding MarR family transcriptional regulator
LVIIMEGELTVADVAELAEGLHRVLMALNLRAHRRDRSRVAIGDLTVAQLSILLTLRDQGPIRMTKLSVVERVCKPSITIAIRRLETLGLVKRSRDTADLRLVFVELTRKGLAVQRQSLANHQANAVTLLSRLSQAELDALTKALAPLERLADSADRRSPATSKVSAEPISDALAASAASIGSVSAITTIYDIAPTRWGVADHG